MSDYKVGDRVAVDPIYWCGECPACRLKHYPACTSLKLLGIDSDGGFGQYVAVKDFMLYRLGENISDRHAAMIELLSIGFHACNRAGIKKDDTVLIVGAGRVGQCILQAARMITDNTIYIVDILAKRLALAEKTWPNVVGINAAEHEPASVIKELTKGRGVDVSFEAVGHARSIENRLSPVCLCIEAIRARARCAFWGLATSPYRW